MVGEQVHLARQSLGCLERGFDGGRLKQWQLGAGQAQKMHQVRSDLVAAEATGVSYELSTLRYEAGVDGYLSKLDAQRSSAAARQDLIAVRQARQGNLLTLYKALGGSWTGAE